MPGPGNPQFPTTQWSLIARLKSADKQEAARALDDVCTQYRYPLYCYIRRRGLEHHDAQDALHDFLSKLLRTGALHTADGNKGRLRGLLAVSLQRFLSNWRQARQKGEREVSLEEEAAFSESERRYLKEKLRDNETPEHLLDRKWAQELLRHVLNRLELDYATAGKSTLFTILKPVLLNGGSMRGEDAEQLADKLGMTEGALRTALSRLLRDYRKVLENKVRQTVESADEVKDELARLRDLFVSR